MERKIEHTCARLVAWLRVGVVDLRNEAVCSHRECPLIAANYQGPLKLCAIIQRISIHATRIHAESII